MFDFQGFLKCIFLKTSDPTENMLLALGSLLTKSDAMFVKNELKWLAIVFESSHVSLFGLFLYPKDLSCCQTFLGSFLFSSTSFEK